MEKTLTIGPGQKVLYLDDDVEIRRGDSGVYYRYGGQHVSGTLSAIDKETFTLSVPRGDPAKKQFRFVIVEPETVYDYNGQCRTKHRDTAELTDRVE